MFCPVCKTEYKDGKVACPDCREVLVDELEDDQADPDPEYISYVTMLTTFNPGDVALIRSIFDAEGIQYHCLGELFNVVRPLADPVRLMVSRDDVGRARALLSTLDLSISGVSTLKTRDDIPD